MATSDNLSAQRYAANAGVSAAEAKSYAEYTRLAEDFSKQAKDSANEAKLSEESAASSAITSENARDIAISQTVRTLRVPDGETLSVLPSADNRKGKFPGFDSVTGDVKLIDISSTDATGLALSLASEGGGELVGTTNGTVEERFNGVESALSDKASIDALSEKISGAITFSGGGVLNSEKDFIYNNADFSWYFWSGPYGDAGKVILPNSSPEGTGGVGPSKWINAGDVALRGEIAGAGGFRLIGAVNGVNQLSTIDVQDGDRVQLLDVIGWAGVRAPIGTGFLRYDANMPKSEHDGFVHFSPTVPFTTLGNYLDGVGETDPGGIGVFVREIYANEVLLSNCGIYENTNSTTDITTATKACRKLFEISNKGYSICFDVELFVADIVVSNINYTINARCEKKLKLGRNGRILKFNNSIASGNVTLNNFELDGGGFISIEDGGLLQSNYVLSLNINNIKLYGFLKNVFQANGIATTGIGCHTNISGGDFSNCGSQLLYLQTTNSTVINPRLHDSLGHAIAFVNCDDLYCVGGSANGCDFGVLTYSTPDYRGSLRRLHIQGISLKGNNKAFEISRRYEQSSVSGGNADVVLSDVDATDCTVASTIGNLATDNIDGYAIREVFIDNLFTDLYLECNSVFGVHIKGGRVNGLRIRGKTENIDCSPGKIIGNGSSSNTNTAIYLYASAIVKNIKLDAFSYYGINSYLYGEHGSVVSGPVVVNNPVLDPPGMTYKVNSELYGYVSLNNGNRNRDMTRQAWGVGKSPFYDTTLGKFVTWNGSNITDMMGNIIP